ncbi:SCO6880 family protein [Demequina sp.]|uniref:SCO6880 family protein n=1 Tax=Demequina sp. TaxID=2050685 RepID=UPI003D09F03F
MTTLRTAFLAGTAGYRTMLGEGPQRRSRLGQIVAVAVAMLGAVVAQLPGLLVGGAIGLVVMLLTNPSLNGDLIGKAINWWRWRTRTKAGMDQYVPFTEDAERSAMNTAGARARRRALGAVRQMPDGAAGMGWLQNGAGVTGIAWHQPPNGEAEYLSVAYEVEGRMRGFESRDNLNRGSEQWGAFLASLGADFSLCKQVQVLTRVLPPRAVLHERWAADHIDPALRATRFGMDLLSSYSEVLANAEAIGTVQRHYVVVRFDVDRDFRARARRVGPDVEGWRRLMVTEIAAMTRRLELAGVGRVRPLSARQVAAMIRHCQQPSKDPDYVADIDPCNFGVASHDSRSVYVTEDPGVDGNYRYTATARIEAPNVDASAKNMFWIHEWLTNMPEPIIRSISFHVRVIPARIALPAARKDETRDTADVAARIKAGALAADDAEAKRVAATIRANELRPGTGHHGVEWIGFVTLTARSLEDLERQSRILTEKAATGLGVRRLEWCREYQSAAAGYTWPIARGLVPHRGKGLGGRVESAISRVDQPKETLG